MRALRFTLPRHRVLKLLRENESIHVSELPGIMRDKLRTLDGLVKAGMVVRSGKYSEYLQRTPAGTVLLQTGKRWRPTND